MHSIEAGKALLIGEGSGAPVAFDLALRAPGFFAGALMIDGLAAPSADQHALALSRACSSRFWMLLGEQAKLRGDCAGIGASTVATALEAWMQSGGLDANAKATPGRAAGLSSEELATFILEIL
ncbi:MAG: pimeloyl-ACP methyl ester carboxylesterase [Candidatus Paceibacteria bacterium]